MLILTWQMWGFRLSKYNGMRVLRRPLYNVGGNATAFAENGKMRLKCKVAATARVLNFLGKGSSGICVEAVKENLLVLNSVEGEKVFLFFFLFFLYHSLRQSEL
jgi:hypothetical protein